MLQTSQGFSRAPLLKLATTLGLWMRTYFFKPGECQSGFIKCAFKQTFLNVHFLSFTVWYFSSVWTSWCWSCMQSDTGLYIFVCSVCKGGVPKLGDRVLVEASYNANMPFKWNATRIQVCFQTGRVWRFRVISSKSIGYLSWPRCCYILVIVI